MFGIGTFELMIIAGIALLVLGPEELARFLRKGSMLLAQIRTAADELRRQAGFDELAKETREAIDQGVSGTVATLKKNAALDQVEDAANAIKKEVDDLSKGSPVFGDLNSAEDVPDQSANADGKEVQS